MIDTELTSGVDSRISQKSVKSSTMESNSQGETAEPITNNVQDASVERIQQLLKAKDDTSRFVGLALLKSTLDASEELRNDQTVVVALWSSISPKFLDRLLRTGSKPGARQGDAKEMLDLAANVIYTFAVLLPQDAKDDVKLAGRVPLLIHAILQRCVDCTNHFRSPLY